MKLSAKVLVTVLLMSLSSKHCFASIVTTFKHVSREWAVKDLGMKITPDPFDTNQVTVSFQFIPADKLAGFNYVRLKIYSELYETSTFRGEIGRPITSSVLQPMFKSKDKVIVSFSIDRAYLDRTEIQVVLFNDPEYHEHPSVGVDGHGYRILPAGWLAPRPPDP